MATGDCVVLEDAPTGVQAAVQAGARVIALRTTHPDVQLTAADALIDNLSALAWELPS